MNECVVKWRKLFNPGSCRFQSFTASFDNLNFKVNIKLRPTSFLTLLAKMISTKFDVEPYFSVQMFAVHFTM